MNMHWLDAPLSAPYRWTLLGAVALSAIYWWRHSKKDSALLPIYIGALCGAFLGAKIAYLLAEGWRDWQMEERWLRLLNGKSVVGGLLGGFAGVELIKWTIRYHKPTGDAFAPIVPLGIALGRVGCWLQGCCLGKPMPQSWLAKRAFDGSWRWPAAQIELGFQLAAFIAIVSLRKHPFWKRRLFFAYLAAYGVFRFVHEFVRDTPRWLGGWSGYQWLSLLMMGIGLVAFRKRGRSAEE